MFDNLFYLFLFLTIFFEIFAQYLYKLIHNKKLLNYGYNENIFILIGVIFYALTGFFSFKILKYGELGVINIIWHLLHFIILFIIGYYFLNERLTFNKKIGCIFGIIALILFMIDGHQHH